MEVNINDLYIHYFLSTIFYSSYYFFFNAYRYLYYFSPSFNSYLRSGWRFLKAWISLIYQPRWSLPILLYPLVLILLLYIIQVKTLDFKCDLLLKYWGNSLFYCLAISLWRTYSLHISLEVKGPALHSNLRINT